MGEILALLALGAAGLMVLAPCEGRLPRVALGSLAFPLGATTFAIVAAASVATIGTVRPLPILLATVTIGLASLVAGILSRRVTAAFVAPALITVALIGAAAALLWGVHLTRLTIDSMRYLLASVDLQLAAGITEVHPTDLLQRQLALPAWHTIAAFTDRRYVAGLSPLFGLSGAVFLGWLVWSRSVLLGVRRPRMLVAATIAFVLSSNRLLLDWFYINTHIALAVLVLVAVAGLWLATLEEEDAWALPAGIALAGTLMLRAEAPLVVALVLVAFAPVLPSGRSRWFAATPAALVAVVWYAATLWRHAPGGREIAFDAPVLMGLVAVGGAVVVTWAGGVAATRRLVARGPTLLLLMMTAALVGFVVLEPSVFVSTVSATAVNVGYLGLWAFAWTVLVPVLVVALVVQHIPWGRAWATVVVGYGLLFFLLPYLRGSPWRPGPGDSGNRILAHVFLVAVAFAVLAAVEGPREGPGRLSHSLGVAEPNGGAVRREITT